VELLQLSMLAIKVSVLTLVFALGLNATTAEATYLFRHPRRLLRGFLALAVVVPAVAAAFALVADLPRPVAITIIAMSISPVALGIAVRHFWTEGAERLGPWLTKAATVVLAVALLPILARAWPAMRGLMGTGMPLAVVVVTIASAMRHPGVYSPSRAPSRPTSRWYPRPSRSICSWRWC